jgi:hypothetical protein
MKIDRYFRLSEIPGTGVHCSLQGLFVGQIRLLEQTSIQGGRLEWRARPSNEIERDLRESYGLPLELTCKLSGLTEVGRALDRGDLVRAQITTLLLQFPDPPSEAKKARGFDEVVDLAKRLQASDLLERD